MRIRILPYKIGSESAKLLAQGLGLLRCNPINTRFVPRWDDVIINWGCSSAPSSTLVTAWGRPKYINHPNAVRIVANKRNALSCMALNGVSVVPSTINRELALTWLEEGSYIYERHTLNGHGGSGIRVVHSPDDLSANGVQLYTRGIRIRREYRVHVFDGKVIDYVQKRRKFDADPNEVSEYIRNHTHGWVFCRSGFDRIEEVERQAIAAVEALGLNFGAVDIIQEKITGNVYVLEVNTAAGFSGPESSTLQAYINTFKEKLNI